MSAENAGKVSGVRNGSATEAADDEAWPTDTDNLILASVVCALAILTNGLQMFSVFAKRRTRRSLFHLFSGHTSVANLVTVVASFPLDVHMLHRETWYRGSGVCKLILTVAVVGPAVVAFSLLLLHMERLLRYLSRGRKTLRAEPHLRGVIGLALAILIWVIAFILVLPFVVTMEKQEDSAHVSCSVSVLEMHTVSMTALTMIIPSGVLVLLCLPNVSLYLLAGHVSGWSDVTEADKVQAGVLAMVTCLYLATRLPVEILQLIRLLVVPLPALALKAFSWVARVGMVVMPCLWFMLPQLRRNMTCRKTQEKKAQPSILRVAEALSVV